MRSGLDELSEEQASSELNSECARLRPVWQATHHGTSACSGTKSATESAAQLIDARRRQSLHQDASLNESRAMAPAGRMFLVKIPKTLPATLDLNLCSSVIGNQEV
jgi:hypothetical protein